ncbi:MAG: VWA domain-containing protein [Blastocatellia bacterium]|nr:VWA domain-containing protein [Blastocatellia bacterium]
MENRFTRVVLAILLAGAIPVTGSATLQQKTDNQNINAAQQQGDKPDGNDSKAAAPKREGIESRQDARRKSDDRVTLDANLVSLNVTVTDMYGRFVTGLKKEHFEVYDEKVKQRIEFFSNRDVPVSLGLVYDVSGSMKSRASRSIRALTRFFETSHNDDDFFLIAFNDRAQLVQDFTTSADQILGRLMFVEAKKSTALYDAAYLSVEKIRQGRHSKRALLIISDGQDNNSRYTYKELRNLVKEADVIIYAIGITDPYNDSLSGYGRSVLSEMARMTGGRAFFPTAYNEMELVEICTRIALELRHQYAIGFYPTDTKSEEKWRDLKVKIKPPKGIGRLSLTYKDGYQSFKR